MTRIVVKWGGSLQLGGGGVADDIAQLWRQHELTIVHGGSRDINETMDQLSIAHRTLQSPDGMVTRYTDEATLDALQMAVRGRTQPRIVSMLAERGVPAVGLSGMDGALAQTVRKSAVRAVERGRLRIVRDNLAGRIVSVNPALLRAVHDIDMLPVICPPAITSQGEITNVDADRLAAMIAVGTGADLLILLTDVPGLLADVTDPSSVVRVLSCDSAVGWMPRLESGMRMKIVAVLEALDHGVGAVRICDGRSPSPLVDALRGAGTLIVKDGDLL